MRAITLLDTSFTTTLSDLPKPTPGAGQVLVRVRASSLNGFDIAVAAGYLQGMMEYRFPVVLGKDFAGEIKAIGEGATKFSVGDRVFGVVMTPYLGEGALGEYVVVSEGYAIAKLPDGISFAEAGAIGVAGAAAVGAIDALNLNSGKTLLIVGATGGVGALAIQYAISTGARVIATARAGAESDFVRSFGATDVVDGRADLDSQVKAIAPNGVDAIVHLAGDATALVDLLADGGQIASLLGFGPDKHASAIAIMGNPDETTLNRLASDIASKKIRVPITQTISLEEVPAAVASFAGGKLGKISVAI